MIQAAAHVKLNMQALRHNVDRVREYAPESKVMAVIKANAYGHGMVTIAQHLSSNVDALAVARIDEAVRLRAANITGRILVLQGFTQAEELDVFLQYQLDAVVHSEQQIQILEAASLDSQLSVFFKVDTGMNRLGVLPKQFSKLLLRLQQCASVNPSISFMTHFSNADDIQDNKTAQQLALFEQLTKGYGGDKSCANSAAIVAWPEARTDWVRPGLMLYGVSPLLHGTAKSLDLKPVMSLYSRIIALKQVTKGEAVGYGSGWVAEKEMLIGVVSIGYGDGYPRYAKNGTPVLIANTRVPLAGRVSMDMLTIDLSTCPKTKIGDKVTLWGEGLSVEEIASYSGTIPYTLLCGITRRVQVISI